MIAKRLLIVAGVLCVAAFSIFQIASQLFITNTDTIPRQQISDVLPDDTKNIFENADVFTLLSLDPNDGYSGPNDFHGYKILGKTSVNTETRKQLVDAFYTAITAEDISAASCFFPRHGIRAEKDGQTLDLVICFECQQMAVIPPGKTRQTIHWPNFGHPGPTISRSAESDFDYVLKTAGITLAPKKDEP